MHYVDNQLVIYSKQFMLVHIKLQVRFKTVGYNVIFCTLFLCISRNPRAEFSPKGLKLFIFQSFQALLCCFFLKYDKNRFLIKYDLHLLYFLYLSESKNASNIFVLKEIIPDNFNVKFQLDVI